MTEELVVEKLKDLDKLRDSILEGAPARVLEDDITEELRGYLSMYAIILQDLGVRVFGLRNEKRKGEEAGT